MTSFLVMKWQPYHSWAVRHAGVRVNLVDAVGNGSDGGSPAPILNDIGKLAAGSVA